MSYYNIQVCTDCYTAHHYGYQPVSPEDDYSTASGAHSGPHTLHPLPLWWVGESDTVTPNEPLHRLPHRQHVSDNTCPEHETPCTFCNETGYDNGLTEFSWASCDGCGSHLGGARYRLAVHDH